MLLLLLLRQFSVTASRCCLLFVLIVCAQHTAGDVTDDVRDDDVTTTVSPPGGICPACLSSRQALHQLPQADIVRIHVERIKRELLRKLGLSAAPNMTGRTLPNVHFLPGPLLTTRPGNPRDDVTDEDEVFPDDDVDHAVAMSDDVASQSHQHYHGAVDSDHGYDDEDDDSGSDEEFDLDGIELGPPQPPPRSKQIIVLGQPRMFVADYFNPRYFTAFLYVRAYFSMHTVYKCSKIYAD